MYEKITTAILTALGGFFLPLYSLMFGMFVMVNADMVTGMLAARQRGEVLSSAKMKRTVIKMIVYACAIILFHVLDATILSAKDLYLAQGATGIIAGVELFSVLENMYSITGNQVFYLLTQWAKKKVTETTGADLENADRK